jgi:hypothetical protein
MPQLQHLLFADTPLRPSFTIAFAPRFRPAFLIAAISLSLTITVPSLSLAPLLVPIFGIVPIFHIVSITILALIAIVISIAISLALLALFLCPRHWRRRTSNRPQSTRHGQRQHARRPPAARLPANRQTQHMSNSLEKLHLSSSDSSCQAKQGFAGRATSDKLKRRSVCDFFPRGRHRQAVAAQLALAAHLTRQPPNRRVKKQHRLQRTLQQVHPQIVPPNVRQLMRQHGFHHRRRQFGQPCRGQYDQRPEKTGGNRFGQLRRNQQPRDPA